MIDGPMTSRRRVIEEGLLERALNELEQAMANDDLHGILEASKHLKDAVDYLPEKMPTSTIYRRLSGFNTLRETYGDNSELFNEEFVEFRQLLIDEMVKRG